MPKTRKTSARTCGTSFDPVTLAILNKRFEAVTTRMANTLLRSGRSGVLNLARDFSTSVVTRDCELLAGAESLPIHHLSGADLMAKAMVQMHPVLKAGDAFLHNSPYHGGSHPADHTILVPVVDPSGEHRYTIWVKAHQADCGNALPTTYMGDARAMALPLIGGLDPQTHHDWREIFSRWGMLHLDTTWAAVNRGIAWLGGVASSSSDSTAVGPAEGAPAGHSGEASWRG